MTPVVPTMGKIGQVQIPAKKDLPQSGANALSPEMPNPGVGGAMASKAGPVMVNPTGPAPVASGTPQQMPVSRFAPKPRIPTPPRRRPPGMASGGSVSSASKRADGCAQRGKTKGKMY